MMIVDRRVCELRMLMLINMTYELIITEKPDAAKMIAIALSDSKPIKEMHQGVPYYKISHKGKDIVIGCAVGHLYTVAEKTKSFNYPVYELEWKPNTDQEKSYTKKYIATLKKITKDATKYTVATDYDIEGEVIGLNILRFICKQEDAARMKFSTLTKPDLVEAYNKKSPTIDWGQAYAGETRHYMDWLYGINMSRALTHAIKSSGMFKIMSSGRVQGPALKLVVELEKEIKAFKPENYWQLSVKGHLQNAQNSKTESNTQNMMLEFWHVKDRIMSEQEALIIYEKVNHNNGTIKKVQKSEFVQRAPVPFDLTTLQTEAYRLFHISPKHTLDIAQSLYTAGYISYPRTSSQKLPKEIGYKKIIESLAKNPEFPLAKELLNTTLRPNEGKKTDPAHPAIYPTGITAKHKDERHQKVYDLIVKRFMACFGPDAKRVTATITMEINTEPFICRGTRTIFKGWHKYYEPYVTFEEQQLPEMKENDTIINKETIKHDKQTQPPKRYTPASIIKELEKKNLGTKATRASIIDSLYQRNYVKDESIEATELGIQTIDTLEKFCPEIIDEKLTRHFENEMERIREKKLTEDQVLGEAKNTLAKILDKFKKNEKQIGKELGQSHKESMNTAAILGKCPVCNVGNLKIMYSRKSKRKFIACDHYPKCKTIMNMPSFIVKPTEKICEHCKYPIVKIGQGKSSRETCLNNDCVTKKTTDKTMQKHIDAIENGPKVECPKCGKPLILRQSIYGQFLGCTGFPKCRYTEKIPKDEQERKVVEQKRQQTKNQSPPSSKSKSSSIS